MNAWEAERAKWEQDQEAERNKVRVENKKIRDDITQKKEAAKEEREKHQFPNSGWKTLESSLIELYVPLTASPYTDLIPSSSHLFIHHSSL